MSVKVDTDNGEVRATRTIRQSGNSVVVVIPPELLDAAGFDLGDKVEIATDLEREDIILRSNDLEITDGT